jgi:hypothetical protein
LIDYRQFVSVILQFTAIQFEILTIFLVFSGLEGRLMDFFPSVNQQQTEENFTKTFQSRDLAEIVTFRKQQAAAGTRSGTAQFYRFRV